MTTNILLNSIIFFKTERDNIAEFMADRIPTSQFFEIDGVADRTTGLPHMHPSEK